MNARLLATSMVVAWTVPALAGTTPSSATRELLAAARAPGAAPAHLGEYLDVELLVDASLAPHIDKMTAEQAADIKQAFHSLLKLAPILATTPGDERKLDFDVTVAPAVYTGDVVRVSMAGYDLKTDTDIDLAFDWIKVAAAWRVSDVILNDASLVKGYRNQFGRIINRHGVDDLVKRLNKRLVELRGGQTS